MLWENATDRDDLRNIFNPNKGPNPGAYMQKEADPAPATEESKAAAAGPKIPKYEPRKVQGGKPVEEQAKEEATEWTYRTDPDNHDYNSPLNAVSDYEKTNFGNLSRYPNQVEEFNGPTTMRTASYRWQGNPQYVSAYGQIDPAKPTGLVPPPVDQQYEGVPQLKKPLIIENATDKDDFRNVYNPNKLPNLAKKPAAAPKMAQETAVSQDNKKQGEKRWEDGFNILPPAITDHKKEITEVNKSLTNRVINQRQIRPNPGPYGHAANPTQIPPNQVAQKAAQVSAPDPEEKRKTEVIQTNRQLTDYVTEHWPISKTAPKAWNGPKYDPNIAAQNQARVVAAAIEKKANDPWKSIIKDTKDVMREHVQQKQQEKAQVAREAAQGPKSVFDMVQSVKAEKSTKAGPAPAAAVATPAAAGQAASSLYQVAAPNMAKTQKTGKSMDAGEKPKKENAVVHKVPKFVNTSQKSS